jgi:hypothetical protein
MAITWEVPITRAPPRELASTSSITKRYSRSEGSFTLPEKERVDASRISSSAPLSFGRLTVFRTAARRCRLFRSSV